MEKGSRRVRVGTLSRVKHTHPVPRDEYIDLCLREAHSAGRQGCDIFLLPEHFDSFGSREMEPSGDDFDPKAARRSIAEPVPGRLTQLIGQVCRQHGMYIIANFTEAAGEKQFNSAVLLGRTGEVEGIYRKTHLCGTEKRVEGIDAGDSLPVFDLDFGRIGIAICMDMYFPEVFRVLTLKNAEIIFWPHQTYGPSEEMILVTARARAIDYGCYLVGANFASPDYFAPYAPGHAYTGRAFVINPDGVLLCDTGHTPGAAFAEIDLACPRLGKDIVAARRAGIDHLREDLLHFRRPELYRKIVEPCDNAAMLEGRFLD